MHFLPTSWKTRAPRPAASAACGRPSATPAAHATRIKDVTMVEGGRDNQLVGYGLVVGLAGDGDSKINFTVQSVANMLKRFGIDVPADRHQERQRRRRHGHRRHGPLPPSRQPHGRDRFLPRRRQEPPGRHPAADALARRGRKSLRRFAQGPLASAGSSAARAARAARRCRRIIPRSASISGGAIVEREVPTQFAPNGTVNLLLRSPDFSTASRVAESINHKFPGSSLAKDASTVSVYVPIQYMTDYKEVDFLTRTSAALDVVPDSRWRASSSTNARARSSPRPTCASARWPSATVR